MIGGDQSPINIINYMYIIPGVHNESALKREGVRNAHI